RQHPTYPSFPTRRASDLAYLRGDPEHVRCRGAARSGNRRLRTFALWDIFEEDRDVVVSALRLTDVRSAAVCLSLWAHLDSELAYAVPFRKHSQRNPDDGVPADQLFNHGAGGSRCGVWQCQGAALVASGDDGMRHGVRHPPRARMEQADRGGAHAADVPRCPWP